MTAIAGVLAALAGVLVIVRFRQVAEGIAGFHESASRAIPFLYRALPFFKSRSFWSTVTPLMGLLFVGVGAYFVWLGMLG
jgi:hypothetical protein